MAVDVKAFQDGMNSDNDVVMQPENTYRRLVNGNIMNLGGKRFSVELSPGNSLSFTLQNDDYTPIGFIAFVSFLAVISTNTKPGYTPVADGTEFGIVKILPDGTGNYIPLYNHVALGFSMAKLIEGHGREENSFIKRGYFTDNHVAPKVFNFGAKVYSNHLTSGTLVATDVYMVIKGSVTSGVNTYGPGDTNGTVFTATGAEVWTANDWVIVYVPVEILDWIPKKNNGTIGFKEWVPGGSVKDGMYQFAYQLEGLGGVRSGWSYVTRMTHITADIPSNLTMGYQQYQGGPSTSSSGKSIRLTISDIDTFYTSIRVAVIPYLAYNVQSLPMLFYEGDITASSMDVVYDGGINLLKLTNDDLIQINLALKTVKTVVSFKNRNLPANLSEYSDFNWEPTADVNVAEYLVFSDIMGYDPDPTNDIPSGFGINGHAQLLLAGNTGIYPKQWYKVTGTTGVDFVTYNFTAYGPGQVAGDVFQGIPGTAGFLATGTPVVLGILHISLYGTGANQVFKDIVIVDDWADCKGMTVQTHIGSYFRGEITRIGIEVYDPMGNPLFVKWLADKHIDNQYQTQDGVNLRLCEKYSDKEVCLRNIGFNISNLDLNDLVTALQEAYNDASIVLTDINKYISGFSIVRAPRDGQIIAQGLWFPTVIDGNTTRPSALNSLQTDVFFVANGRRPNTYLMYSPDINFGLTTTSPQEGDLLQIADYYDPGKPNAGIFADPGQTDTNVFHYYQKFYAQAIPAAGQAQSGHLNGCDGFWGALVNFGQTGVGYGPSTFQFDNVSGGLGASAPCLLAGWIFNRESKGAKTRLFYTSYPDTNWNNGYGDNLAASECKPIVNWIRPNSNPYGGTSDTAKANTKYVYCGHYQKLDAAFMAYIVGNSGIVDNIEVFGGDCYVTIFDIGKGVGEYGVGSPFSLGILFPVESMINTFLREGRHFSRDRSYETPVNMNGLNYGVPANSEEYTFPSAYLSFEKIFSYPGLPVGFIPNSKFERRARYSNLKLDGEIIDSFREFLVNNFQEAEGINGEINNLIVAINHLIYLQDRGVGYFPINERETVTGALGSAVQLGIGGIMDRFDNISNFYGNQHQWGVIRMPDRIAWFDMRNRMMLMMSFGSNGIQEYSVIKGVESELEALFDSIEQDASPNIFDSDQPLLNRGIAGGYDPKYKMGLLTFKFTKDDGTGFLVDQSITLGINKTLDKPIGWFDFCPGLWVHHAGQLLSVPTMANEFVLGHTYIFGELISQNNINYVCILGFTATNNSQKPLTNSTNFKQINSGKQIFVSWRGPTGRFYGKVYNHLLQFVVNKDNYEGKCVDVIEINSSPLNYDKMRFTVDNATILENTKGNRSYKYFDGSWQSTVPMAGRERLTDNYLLIEGIVENFDTDPTISLDKKKIITSVKSTYRIKK